MTISRSAQLLSESSSWKRLLGFLIEENTHCKNRISEILNSDFQIRLLADMENFQTGFIQTDTMIALLRNEVAEFDKMMQKLVQNQPASAVIYARIQKIRHGISAAEKTFISQQSIFNGYLADNT